MSDFLNFVLSYLGRAIIIAVFALIPGVCLLLAAAKGHRRRHGPDVPFPWARWILILLLTGYLAVVMFVTVRQGGFYNGRCNFHLFRAWREAWNSFSQRQWLNVLLNIAMFVPLGILVPLIWPKFQKWYRMLPAGFGVSLLIELAQLLTGSGLFDVDDLFNNTLGAMMGFWPLMAVLSLPKRKWGICLRHTLALASAAAAICSIFVIYDRQEYGNLSSAPVFRVYTGDVQWTVSCPLSDEAHTVDIYKTKPWTRAECEAFGRKFLGNLGARQVDVTVYNDEVYLREFQGARILEVFYQDGHYSYADLDMSREFVQVEEEILREALLEFGIQIPEEARFSCPDGQTHYFRVDRYPEGESLLDGTVAVQYEEGQGIRTIENSLVTVTYHAKEPIISPEDAVRQLKEGHLANGDWFERSKPKKIEIRSCALSYQVDTKGFYQPVYLVELLDPATGNVLLEAVPALT